MASEIQILDTAVGFAIPERHARGRIVRLGPALDAVLGAHGYPPVVEKLLAEAIVLAALLGSTLKHDEGQLTLQAQAEGGAIELMVADYRNGEVRGYIRHDPLRLAEIPADPSLFALFGRGYLAITFDQAVTGERYQGIVPLEGGSLAEAAETYFSQSEQLPSLVRLASRRLPDGRHVAGGLLVQHLPEGEEGRDRIHTRLDHPEWEHVHALAQTVTADELADPDLPIETILWRLFNEDEVRTYPGVSLARGCRCDPAHIRTVIARFPPDERAGMADEQGEIHVDCEFCAKRFSLALDSI
ncbi:Hsp33 family molecular chaperone HslO [Sphingomonas histidinilytica]|uniref:Molecular chaperone Hsp33 n=1 Tax=Rhizorhabdus histidinilytica TaxID=439228 RepID=A0A1T5C3U8_9SPHN|nr:Hsp33 family molecular chaperone HslO [Rhizorhabdus histidinilytica]MBO9375366.1 Hsp33 family molecular chaperone HslO [Rhizorhabdus histidinilytica]QEH77268.1 Hsp33 family molecular chaperone HslO [Sphingomonas sp. C8-2]SKB54056.1 molecular chaperone Hsp33 [Rhizorhabdus histidinilytica]